MDFEEYKKFVNDWCKLRSDFDTRLSDPKLKDILKYILVMYPGEVNEKMLKNFIDKIPLMKSGENCDEYLEKVLKLYMAGIKFIPKPYIANKEIVGFVMAVQKLEIKDDYKIWASFSQDLLDIIANRNSKSVVDQIQKFQYEISKISDKKK